MLFRWIAQLIYVVLLFIETVLAIRFIFKLFEASSGNAFVNWVYKISGFFMQPFNGIIGGNVRLGSFYIDVNALISLLIYMIFAFIAIEIIKAFTPRNTAA